MTPLTKNDLYNFTGTEHYYQHPLFPRYKFTDGVHHVVDKGMALWLLTKILSLTPTLPEKVSRFGVWKLKKHEDESADLICEDGNCKEVYREKIDYTDFPLDEIEFWMEGEVLILPSEH